MKSCMLDHVTFALLLSSRSGGFALFCCVTLLTYPKRRPLRITSLWRNQRWMLYSTTTFSRPRGRNFQEPGACRTYVCICKIESVLARKSFSVCYVIGYATPMLCCSATASS
ncbi:hypothetical protein F4860DRAFT_299209 [Xylaria cubensis]|nr:hypothetical protein F4860DRAFT_299209 [Xylaria cubensis]